ncbi:hypothetical protein JW758_04700 [Candidatus Peregrinibacteria bacterium]|nr:hypothetical protein [Candidatus Peregrinibacteria bacterium]
MKKLLSLALFFSFAFALSGCGNNPPSLEDRVASELQDGEISYDGIIEPLEIDVYQQGTHQIRTEGNELVIIQSQSYDLNKFLDKQVKIKGNLAEQKGNAEPVLNVTEVKLEDGELVGELETYDNSLYGFSFEYPKIWELESISGGVSLVDEDYEWVKIEVFSDKADLDSFVNTQENEEGTSVTIATQRSIRFSDGETLRIYIPNPPKKKVYRVVFNGDKRDSDGNKELFYNLLESFNLIYKTVRTGDKCGGKDNIKCGEGYICELSSAEVDASGVCVLVDDEQNKDCPMIPPPLECEDYRVSEYSKTTGCPSRYECTDDGISSFQDENKYVDIDSLIGTIEEYQDKILPVSDVTIIQYEISENESLIAVVYGNEEMEYKTLYSFAPSASEYNFIEKAHFEEGEGGGWRLISGKDVQSGLNKDVVKAEGTIKDSAPREVSSDMSLYENQFKEFTMEYPKNWYYRSFGAINNTRWIVGFAENEVENLSDADITVSILDEKPENTPSGMYLTVKNRDDDTIYVVEGPIDLKDTINKMADSIE